MPVSRTISVWLRRVPTGIDKVKYAGENQTSWEETRRVYEDNLRLKAKIPGGWRENIGYLPPLDTTGVHRFCDGVHGVHHLDTRTVEPSQTTTYFCGLWIGTAKTAKITTKSCPAFTTTFGSCFDAFFLCKIGPKPRTGAPRNSLSSGICPSRSIARSTSSMPQI